MNPRRVWLVGVGLLGLGGLGMFAYVGAQEEKPLGSQEQKVQRKEFQQLPPPVGAKKLSPAYGIWVDPEKQQVLIDGQVSSRNGWLEMLACPAHSPKDYDSIVSLDTKAFLVHAALLQVGAEPGTTVEYEPKYKPATGTEIEIDVQWLDEEGKLQTAKAQEWIINGHTKEPLKTNWVFAGSRFWKNKQGKEIYLAERGHLICVSNFYDATLDLPIESSETDSELGYFTNTDKIPELGTPVRLILKLQASANADKPKAETKFENKRKE